MIPASLRRNTPLRSGWTPADRPQRPVLFVNPRSGGGKAARAAVAEQARERGIEVVVLAPDASLDALGGRGGGRWRRCPRRRRRGRLARRRGRRGAGARDPLRVHPRRYTKPLRARCGRGPARRGRRPRRVHRRGRAPDRRCRGERAPLPQQRVARHLRRRGAATGVPRREGAHAAGHRASGARSGRRHARVEPGGRSGSTSTVTPRR